MLRFALSGRWWIGHVLVVAAFVTFLLLGDWQWVVSRSAVGSAQNLGYALQWPLFAVAVVAGWVQILRTEYRRTGSSSPVPSPPSTLPPPLPTRIPSSEVEPDDELAAYNAYLAGLARRDAGAS